MSKHVKKAVDALYAVISTGLEAQLRLVETAESIAADSLTDPERYIKASVPLDNASPLIQIYATSFDMNGVQQRHEIMFVSCSIVFSYASDAQLEAAELFVMRYVWAIIDTILADQTLGGEGAAYITGGDSDVAIGDNATTRHVEVITVEVEVHSA